MMNSPPALAAELLGTQALRFQIAKREIGIHLSDHQAAFLKIAAAKQLDLQDPLPNTRV